MSKRPIIEARLPLSPEQVVAGCGYCIHCVSGCSGKHIMTMVAI